MATIGNLAIKLTASAGAFVASMGKAAKSVGALTYSLTGLNAVSGTVKAAIGAVIGGSFIAWIKSAADAVVATARLSRELEATTQGLTTLGHGMRMLGGDESDVAAGLQALNDALVAATHGSSGTLDAFNRIGLSAASLAKIPVDQAFIQIAKRIAAIPDPSQRAAAAVGIFGDSAKKLLPLLAMGEAGIAKFAAEAERSGLGFSAEAAGRVEAAKASLTAVMETFRGIATQIAIAVAPWVKAFADQLLSAGNTGTTVGALIMGAFKAVAKSVAFVKDVISAIGLVFRTMALGVLKITEVILRALQSALYKASRVPGFLGGDKALKAFYEVRNAADAMEEKVTSMRASLKEDLLKPSAMESVDKFFTAVEAGAGRAGAAIAKVRGAGGSVGKAFKLGKFFEEGKRVFDEVKTPLQTFQDKLTQINRLVGYGAISWTTYARGAMRAVAELERAHQLAEIRLPAGLNRESGEATSAINRAERLNDLRLRESPQQRLERILQQSAEIEKQQLEYARRIAEALTKRPVPVKI